MKFSSSKSGCLLQFISYHVFNTHNNRKWCLSFSDRSQNRLIDTERVTVDGYDKGRYSSIQKGRPEFRYEMAVRITDTVSGILDYSQVWFEGACTAFELIEKGGNSYVIRDNSIGEKFLAN